MNITGNKNPWDSPCVGICSSTNLGDDVCVGCGRTFQQVVNWNKYTKQRKIETNSQLKINQLKKTKVFKVSINGKTQIFCAQNVVELIEFFKPLGSIPEAVVEIYAECKMTVVAPVRRTPEIVSNFVCKTFDVGIDAIRSPSRSPMLVRVRSILSYLLRMECLLSLNEVADYMYRDHTTIIDHVNKVSNEIEQPSKNYEDLLRLCGLI